MYFMRCLLSLYLLSNVHVFDQMSELKGDVVIKLVPDFFLMEIVVGKEVYELNLCIWTTH